MLKLQNLDEAKVVLMTMIQEQNVSINYTNEIQTLKMLFEKADSMRSMAKQKVTELEEKVGEANKAAKDQTDKHKNLHLVDIVTIQELVKQVTTNKVLAGKGYAKVVLYVGRLEILHDIFLEHTFRCKKWDTIYSKYEVKFPPLLTRGGDAAEYQEEDGNDEETAFDEAKKGNTGNQ